MNSAPTIEAGIGAQVSRRARLGIEAMRWHEGAFDQTLWVVTATATATLGRVTIGGGGGFGHWAERAFPPPGGLVPLPESRFAPALRAAIGYEIPVGPRWAVGPRLSYTRTATIISYRYELWHVGVAVTWH